MSRQSSIERFKSMEKDAPPAIHRPKIEQFFISASDWNAQCRRLGWSWAEICWRRSEACLVVGGCVHFIGFRGDEYWSAVRIWGKPDYTWPQATWHILGDIAPEDTVIFAAKAFNKGKYHRNGLRFPHEASKARVP